MQTAPNATTASDLVTGSLSYIDTLVGNTTSQGLYRITCDGSLMNDEMMSDLIDNYGYSVNKYTDDNFGSFPRYVVEWDNSVYIPNIILTYDFGVELSTVSGTQVSDTIGNSNATLHNNPSYTSGDEGYVTFVGGSSQYMINNDDIGGYFSGTNPNKSTSITFSMWIYPTGNGVVLNEVSLDGYHNSVIEIVSGQFRFGFWKPSGGLTVMNSNITTPFNRWYHVVLTYDGTTMTGYINNVSVCSTTTTRLGFYNLSPARALYYAVGAAESTNFGDGTYGDFRLGVFEILDGPLSSAQVSNRFKFYRDRFGV